MTYRWAPWLDKKCCWSQTACACQLWQRGWWVSRRVGGRAATPMEWASGQLESTKGETMRENLHTAQAFWLRSASSVRMAWKKMRFFRGAAVEERVEQWEEQGGLSRIWRRLCKLHWSFRGSQQSVETLRAQSAIDSSMSLAGISVSRCETKHGWINGSL